MIGRSVQCDLRDAGTVAGEHVEAAALAGLAAVVVTVFLRIHNTTVVRCTAKILLFSAYKIRLS